MGGFTTGTKRIKATEAGGVHYHEDNDGSSGRNRLKILETEKKVEKVPNMEGR